MKSLLAKILGLTTAIWNFYAPLLRQLALNGTGALLPLALDIVRSLAESDQSGAEKREEAVSALKAAAIHQGIAATESLIRWSIESAVQRMKTEGK